MMTVATLYFMSHDSSVMTALQSYLHMMTVAILYFMSHDSSGQHMMTVATLYFISSYKLST